MEIQKGKYPLPFVIKCLFIGIISVNVIGIFNPVFTQDSALYASIAKRFLVSGDLLNIYVDGHDWLDKPHFPFWMSALSMYVLGISGVAYKLSSLLFFLLSLFYTYRFTKEIYGRDTACWAVLILSSALHIIVSNNDVRAESYLMGTLMGAVYHFYKLNSKPAFKHLFLGSLYTAAGIMTKGVFTLIVPVVAVCGEAVLQKKYRDLFRLRWLWAAGLIVLFITPELYALYRQFDMHPEKVVFGRNNVSGIYFFFVGSQWDRFFNSGPIIQSSGGSPFFFLHTILWAFAPWALLFYASLVAMAKKIIAGGKTKEYYSFVISIVMLLLFSLSGFQLPHYTNIVMPFFSILVAQFILQDTLKKKLTLLKFSFLAQFIIFTILCGGIAFFFQIDWTIFFVLVCFFIGLAYYVYRLQIEDLKKFFYLSCLISIFVGGYLNILFYPKLLTYQAEIQAAKYANEHFPKSRVFIPTYARLFEFYVNNYSFKRYATSDITPESVKEGGVFFARGIDLEHMKKARIPYKKIKEFADFSTTQLNWNFLNYKTREKALNTVYLVEILPQSSLLRQDP